MPDPCLQYLELFSYLQSHCHESRCRAGGISQSEQLDRDFEGATVTFGATDFWVHLEDHSINPLASVSKARPAAIAYDCGPTEGINIVKAAGRYRTLKRFIISYLRGTTEKSDGKMIEIYHFDTKFEMIKSVTEILTEDSDLYGMTSMLIAGPYMKDWGKYMRRNSDGCWKFLASIRGNINLPWIHSSDIDAFVVALFLGLPPQTILAASLNPYPSMRSAN